jgi:undecaprenyl diphosphate synthase
VENLILPNHIALIPDGNRRWARARGMEPWKGHWEAANVFENFLNWCLELKIPQISIWIGSTENLSKRPKREIEELYKVYYHWLEKWEEKKSILDKYEVRVRFVGDLSKLPPKLVKLMGKIMQKTAKYQKRVINVLINYGGKFELVEVFKNLANMVAKTGKIEITEKDVEKNLLVPTPVDLIIRTGGWSRLSNFMLWQSAYAEIYVTKTLFPDFSKREFMKALRWYSSLQRNFGK